MNITYADYIDTILDSNFIFGWNSKPKYKKESYKHRVGIININNQGYEMKIIKYNNSNDIIVEFNDSFHTKKHCGWKEFKKGEVKNPNVPILSDVIVKMKEKKIKPMRIAKFLKNGNISPIFMNGL